MSGEPPSLINGESLSETIGAPDLANPIRCGKPPKLHEVP